MENLKTQEYQENQELMENWVNNLKEMEVFINSFKEIQQAVVEGRKTKLAISVGEAVKEGFLSCLTSNVKNPRILFSSYEDSTGEKIPQVIISDRSNTIACFTLDVVHIVSSNVNNYDADCLFDKYNFTVHIADKFDYHMTMVIYKK